MARHRLWRSANSGWAAILDTVYTPAGLARRHGDDTARSRQRRNWRGWPLRSRLAVGALLLVFGAACAGAAWFRIPALARDTFWAEDGAVFVSGAATHGLGAALVPYAGYLHVVPRLAASAIVMLPVWWWAVATTAASCAIAAALAVVVFVCTRDIVTWLPARLFVASLTVIAPLGPVEVLGNLANLHWLFLWTLFWVVLARPRSRASALALSAIALIGALTEIQAVIWLPLFLLPPRDRRRLLVAAGLGVGLAAQLVATLGWPRTTGGHAPLTGLASLGYGFLINAAMPLAIPQTQIGPALTDSGPASGILILTVIVLAVLYIWRRGSRLQGAVATAAVLGAVMIYCADVEGNPNRWYDYALFSANQLSPVRLLRYGVVPSVLLASALAIAVAVAATRARRTRWSTYAAMAVLAVSACLILLQLGPQPVLRSAGPAFRPQLASSAQICDRAPYPSSVNLKQAPGWTMTVPCARLRDVQQR